MTTEEIDYIDSKINKWQRIKDKLVEYEKLKIEAGNKNIAARGLLPKPVEIGTDNVLFTKLPKGYCIYKDKNILRQIIEAFNYQTGRKIINAIKNLLDSDGPDLCLLYKVKDDFLALRSMVNYGFSAYMISLKDKYDVEYIRDSLIWTIKASDSALKQLSDNLHIYFKWIMDVRSGTIYKSKKESTYYRPTFRKKDKIEYYDVLNLFCYYIWRNLPSKIEQIKEEWYSNFVGKDDVRENLAKNLTEIGLEVTECIKTGKVPENMKVKDYLIAKYKDILSKVVVDS